MKTPVAVHPLPKGARDVNFLDLRWKQVVEGTRTAEACTMPALYAAKPQVAPRKQNRNLDKPVKK